MIRLRSQLLAGPGRILTCTRCHTAVRVLEAAQAAASDEQHRHLDPDTYECGQCLEERGAVIPLATEEAAA